MTGTRPALIFVSLIMVTVAVRMTRLADRIAGATGLWRRFVGVLLLAVATSLPELATSLFAVVSFCAPGLAFGNVFGSNVANLAFIGLLDFMVAGSIFAAAQREHVLNAIWTVVLTVMILGAVGSERWLTGTPFFCGKLFSFIILVAYVVAVHQSGGEGKSTPVPERTGIRMLVLQFVGCAGAILVLGLILTRTCDDLARLTGLGHTFVGVLVLALVTSLPELDGSLRSRYS
ncbi:MAG: hypothetical protein HY815_07990 [Candidatus Riflebacteria bacterium]|nr:hypothetical protein [Candidatus Riflebacteria bacterium]